MLAPTGTQLRRFNAIATGIWLALVVPTVIWWRDSILWVGLMSVWANVASHFSAWQAARAEVAANTNGPCNGRCTSEEAARPGRGEEDAPASTHQVWSAEAAEAGAQ